MPISQANDGWRLTDVRRAGASRGRDDRGGFTLIEVVLALAILSLLVTLGLPFVRPDKGATALRAKTFEITALLRANRNTALQSGTETTVLIDIETATVSAGTPPARIVMPASIALRLSSGTVRGFRFYPDGSASGGRLAILSGEKSYVVEVNSVTSAISIVGGAV